MYIKIKKMLIKEISVPLILLLVLIVSSMFLFIQPIKYLLNKPKVEVTQSLNQKDLSFQVMSTMSRKELGKSVYIKKAKNRFLIVEVKAINFSSRPILIKQEMFVLADDNGNTYEHNGEATVAIGLETNLIYNFDTNIPVRLPVTAYIPFDVPNNGVKLKLQIKVPGISEIYSINLDDSTPGTMPGVLSREDL